MANGKGTLIIIGGREDKKGKRVILKEVARRGGGGKLVIATVASGEPAGMFEEYERVFRNLGVRHLAKLEVEDREQAKSDKALRALEGATAVFFTGGDQLRITSQLGDTPVYSRVEELFADGGLVAGTSAGASVLCETMMVSGDGEQSHRLGDAIRLAPELGLIEGVIIDQHFAERGRVGRLLGAVAQNPKTLGLGIDENTALVVGGHNFEVLGDGAVYVFDASGVSRSNVAEAEADSTLSLFDVKMHLLAGGDRFDLRGRRPRPPRRGKKSGEPAEPEHAHADNER